MEEKILWQNQKRFKLTKEMVEKAKPHSIIHSDYGYIEHPWFNDAPLLENGGNLEKDHRSVKVLFIVYRGGIEDWKIYHSLDGNFVHERYLSGTDHLTLSPEDVARSGQGLYREEIIKSLVDCDEETFAMYRY